MRFYALLGDLRAFVVRHSNCLESGSTKHGKFQTYLRKGTWTHARGMWGLSSAGCFTAGG